MVLTSQHLGYQKQPINCSRTPRDNVTNTFYILTAVNELSEDFIKLFKVPNPT